jgi:hypothetical protein
MRPLQQRHYTPKEAVQIIQRSLQLNGCGKKAQSDLWWKIAFAINDRLAPLCFSDRSHLKMPRVFWI